MEALLGVLSGVCLVCGSVLALVGGIGLLRLPDLFTRMHGSGVTDTGGAGLILIGLMLQSGLGLVTVKLLFILGFLLITSPTSTHALARSALSHGLRPRLTDPEDEPSST